MCGRDIYILNTQGVLVNFRALAEFNKDNRHVYMEVKLQWLWDGHKEHLLSITGQTYQTWGQRRHMTNADLFASKHTFTCIHTPTSPLPFPTGSLLSIHLSSQPASHATRRKQVFISSRWAGAWRYAPLFLVNTSSGSSAPWSKTGVDAGKLTDRGYN